MRFTIKPNFMTRFFILTFLLISTLRVTAQSDMTYVMPPDYIDDNVRINVADIIAQETLYKFKLTVENLSRTDYMAYEMNKTCFELPNVGKYYPNGRKKVIVIEPGTRKSVVISVKVGQPIPLPKFVLTLEGLSMGSLPEGKMAVPNMTVKQGEVKVLQADPLKIELVKSDFKKETYSFQSELSLLSKSASISEIAVFDPNALKTNSGAAVQLSDSKPIVFSADEEEKFKFTVASADPSIELDWSQAFQLISLQGMDVPAFNISNGIAPITAAEVKLCEAQTLKTQGDIQIKITSEVGCFRFFMLGEEMTTDFTSSFTFRMNESVKKVRLVMENGYVVEKSIYAKADYKALYYEVEEKKGEYNLKYLVFASELADGVTPGGAQGIDEVTCDDQITTARFELISRITVQEITSTHVLFKACGSNAVQSISKNDILAVEYSDDSWDKFDFNGGTKQGMAITRNRSEVILKHRIATKGTNPYGQNSFVVGP